MSSSGGVCHPEGAFLSSSGGAFVTLRGRFLLRLRVADCKGGRRSVSVRKKPIWVTIKVLRVTQESSRDGSPCYPARLPRSSVCSPIKLIAQSSLQLCIRRASTRELTSRTGLDIRHAGRQGGREAGRHGGTEAGRQEGREAERQGGREAGRQGCMKAWRQGCMDAGM